MNYWKENKIVIGLQMLPYLACMIFTIGCGGGQTRTDTTVVEQVYLNEANSITVLTRSADGSLKTTVYYSTYGIRFHDDVKPGDNEWFIEHFVNEGIDGWMDRGIDVHVHRLQDLQPGGWNHGKFGHGQLQKLQ